MVKAACCEEACCEEAFRSVLMELVHDVWRKCRFPEDWRDALLAPIPKNGDLSSCENWHGISLLGVVGEIVARVLQVRLQKRIGQSHNVDSGVGRAVQI